MMKPSEHNYKETFSDDSVLSTIKKLIVFNRPDGSSAIICKIIYCLPFEVIRCDKSGQLLLF